MTLSSQRAAKCRGLSEGECGICGCLAAFRGLCVAPKSSKSGVTDSLSAILIASILPPTGRVDFANPLCHPSPNLRICQWRREIRRVRTAGIICPSVSAIRGHSQGHRQAVPPLHTAETPAGAYWTGLKRCRSNRNPQKAGQRLPASCSRNARCMT